MFDDALVAAREGGAGAEQLAQLEVARGAQDVSLEQMREAARRMVDCMVDSGLEATYDEEQLPWGLTLPGYVLIQQEGQVDGAEDSCEAREFHWVNMLYQVQPSTQALRVKAVAEREEIIRQCLKDNGHEAPAEATPVELGNHSAEVSRQTHGAVQCLAEAGVTSW